MSEKNKLETINCMCEKKYDNEHNESVHIVINEGKVIYVSVHEDKAKNYADNREIEAREQDLEKNKNNEDSNKKDIFTAESESDSDLFEVYCIELSKYREDDIIYVGSHEINYNDIIDLLEKEEREEEDYPEYNYTEDGYIKDDYTENEL